MTTFIYYFGLCIVMILFFYFGYTPALEIGKVIIPMMPAFPYLVRNNLSPSSTDTWVNIYLFYFSVWVLPIYFIYWSRDNDKVRYNLFSSLISGCYWFVFALIAGVIPPLGAIHLYFFLKAFSSLPEMAVKGLSILLLATLHIFITRTE